MTRLPIPVLPLLSLVAIGACATLPKAPRDDGLTQLGETTRVGTLTLRPLNVVEDSRCPENARCITAGRLVVRVEVRDGAQRLVREAELGRPDQAGFVLDGAEPGRHTDRKILPAAWRFHWSAVRP